MNSFTLAGRAHGLTAVLRARFLSLLSRWHCLGSPLCTACEFTWSPLRYITSRAQCRCHLLFFDPFPCSRNWIHTKKEEKKKKKVEEGGNRIRPSMACNIVFLEFVPAAAHESVRTFIIENFYSVCMNFGRRTNSLIAIKCNFM